MLEADQYLTNINDTKVSSQKEKTPEPDIILAELKIVELEIMKILEQNYDNSSDWSTCTDNFQRLTFLNCRHVTGNYLRQKYKGTPQELQEFPTGEIQWDDQTFKTLLESMTKRVKTTR